MRRGIPIFDRVAWRGDFDGILWASVIANKAAVQSANRVSLKLPFVQLAFFHYLRLLSWIRSGGANGWKVVLSGQRASRR